MNSPGVGSPSPTCLPPRLTTDGCDHFPTAQPDRPARPVPAILITKGPILIAKSFGMGSKRSHRDGPLRRTNSGSKAAIER